MDIHTPFLTLYSFCFQNVWVDIGPCANQQDLYAYTLHGPWALVWMYDPPNRSPPHSLSIQSGNPISVFQSMCFFPVERFIGVICQSPKGRDFPWYLSFPFGYFLFSMSFSYHLCGCKLHFLHHFFLAEYYSIVYMYTLFLIQTSVHGQRMGFCVLLWWIVLHEYSGTFHFLKRTFSGYMPKTGIAWPVSHTVFMFWITYFLCSFIIVQCIYTPSLQEGSYISTSSPGLFILKKY